LADHFAGSKDSKEGELEKLYHEVLHYVVKGSPAPPPHAIKMATIGLYQKLSGYKIFVETGTLVGETVESASKLFKACHSIELSEKHHNIISPANGLKAKGTLSCTLAPVMKSCPGS